MAVFKITLYLEIEDVPGRSTSGDAMWAANDADRVVNRYGLMDWSETTVEEVDKPNPKRVDFAENDHPTTKLGGGQ